MIKIEQSASFEKWLLSLRDRKAIKIIVTRLNRLTIGHFGDVKPVGNGISELRIHYGAGYRVYFQKQGKKIILLLCGGDKDSQQRDIKLAQQIAEQWGKKDE